MCNPDTCRKVGKKNKKLQICKVLCHTHTTGMNNRCGDGSDRVVWTSDDLTNSYADTLTLRTHFVASLRPNEDVYV